MPTKTQALSLLPVVVAFFSPVSFSISLLLDAKPFQIAAQTIKLGSNSTLLEQFNYFVLGAVIARLFCFVLDSATCSLVLIWLKLDPLSTL